MKLYSTMVSFGLFWLVPCEKVWFRNDSLFCVTLAGFDSLKRWVSAEIADTLDKLHRLNEVRGKLEADVPAAPRGSQLHHGVGVSGSLYEGTAICGIMVRSACSACPSDCLWGLPPPFLSHYQDGLLIADGRLLDPPRALTWRCLTSAMARSL